MARETVEISRDRHKKIARRSVADAAANQVDNFFLAADSSGSLVTLADHVADLAESDAATRDVLRKLVLWLRQARLIIIASCL